MCTIFSQNENKVSAKVSLFMTIALLNGALFALTIPHAGGNNVKQEFDIDNKDTNSAIDVFCVGAGICYTMFYYKTLEGLDFRNPTRAQILLSLLAPFAGFGFLTGGVEGGKQFFTPTQADLVGAFLYGFRILGCVDSCFKFPGRIQEINESWTLASTQKDYPEICRLLFTVLFSLGYALSSTDAIYAATQIVSQWMELSERSASIFSYCSGTLGAIGIFPLILYWIHRGLKQLTCGGVADAQGIKKDPTDVYTLLAFTFVIPGYSLAVVGAAVSKEADMFGRLGSFAVATRISSSVVYAASSGTPGMAALFRDLFKPCLEQGQTQRIFSDTTKPLLADTVQIISCEEEKQEFMEPNVDDEDTASENTKLLNSV
ncbi:MAG TPA: hypothetical protein VHD33_06040 [Legionellaceae bacterium]|nr:hypothetical protein [Legionellaceae bacterium]